MLTERSEGSQPYSGVLFIHEILGFLVDALYSMSSGGGQERPFPTLNATEHATEREIPAKRAILSDRLRVHATERMEREEKCHEIGMLWVADLVFMH